MYVDEMRRAVLAAPRVRLPELSAALWKAYAAGVVSDEDAGSLSSLIEARKVVAPPPTTKTRGARPRSPESLERRRRWVSSGWLPPQLAARFTMGEAAALAVVASEVAKSGLCRLPLGAIAALAGVGKTTVRMALREARTLGLLTVEEHRVSAFRNAPNTVRIVSREWLAWSRLAVQRGKGGGLGEARPTSYTSTPEGIETSRFKGQPMRDASAGSGSSQKASPWSRGGRWRASSERRGLRTHG